VDIDPDNAVLVQSQDHEIQVSLPKEGVDVGYQFYTKGEQLMMKPADNKTEFTFHVPRLCTSSTQFKEDDFHIQEEDPSGEEAAKPISPVVSPQKDTTYLPSTSECLLDDSNVSGPEDAEEEKLKPLIPQDDVILICKNGHKRFWSSWSFPSIIGQPMIEGMAAGNLLLSSSILLSSSNYTKVASLAYS